MMYGIIFIIGLVVSIAAVWGPDLTLSERAGILAVGLVMEAGSAILYSLERMENKIDALAKGKASQGARQQGRDTTQAKVIPDQEVLRYEHFHRDSKAFIPKLVNDCWYAERFQGSLCIWRDSTFSWGDHKFAKVDPRGDRKGSH